MVVRMDFKHSVTSKRLSFNCYVPV